MQEVCLLSMSMACLHPNLLPHLMDGLLLQSLDNLSLMYMTIFPETVVDLQTQLGSGEITRQRMGTVMEVWRSHHPSSSILERMRECRQEDMNHDNG